MFENLIPLGIPRCNSNQTVLPRNCYISRESIRLGIKKCNCKCNLQKINSRKQKELHVIILMTRVLQVSHLFFGDIDISWAWEVNISQGVNLCTTGLRAIEGQFSVEILRTLTNPTSHVGEVSAKACRRCILGNEFCNDFGRSGRMFMGFWGCQSPLQLPFESKLLPAVLLFLRIYFPKITVTVTVLNFGRITITVTVLAPAVAPSFSIDSQLPSRKSFELISSKLPLPLPSWNVLN